MIKYLIILLLISCTKNIDKNIYTLTKKPKNNKSEIKIGIISSSNFLGRYLPHFQTIPVKNQTPQQFKVGGLPIQAGYFHAATKAYNGNILRLDTGDIFSEELDSELTKKVLEAYNFLNYDAVSLSEKEILLTRNNPNKAYKLNIPFINSNIIDIKSRKPLTGENISSYKIIERDGIKIGVISITSFKTISTKYKNGLVGLYFQDPVASIIENKNKLKKENVNAIILLAHINSSCMSSSPQKTIYAKDKKDNQLDCPNDNDQLVNLVKRIPPNSIDLIISSDKNFSNGFIGHIPISQTPGNGKFLSFVEIVFDKESKNLIHKKTALYPAVKLCHEFFVKTEDCFYPPLIDKRTKRHELIHESYFQKKRALFLGELISIDENLENLLNTN